jgi:hypothetical protein
MSQDLLRRFLKEEANSHVRKLLLRHISECRSGAAYGHRTFEFNCFNISIDCESRTVTIEDELDTAPSGEASWSLDEFSAAL